MLLTRRQLNRAKRYLFTAGIAFVIQLGIPHLSLAAQENYRAIANGDPAQFTYTLSGPEPIVVPEADVLDRQEKVSAPFSDVIAFLPLEGEPRIVREHWLTVTAYSSEPRQTDSTPFTTAWITPVRDGVVALNFLPKGSMVRFPDLYGDKVFYVEDRMNVRYPYRADIWMYTREEAVGFGLKYLRMEELSTQVPRDYVLNHFEAAFPGMK